MIQFALAANEHFFRDRIIALIAFAAQCTIDGSLRNSAMLFSVAEHRQIHGLCVQRKLGTSPMGSEVPSAPQKGLRIHGCLKVGSRRCRVTTSRLLRTSACRWGDFLAFPEIAPHTGVLSG